MLGQDLYNTLTGFIVDFPIAAELVEKNVDR